MLSNTNPFLSLPVWPVAFGGSTAKGKIRSHPDDFIVHEQLGFEASGTGEHVFLQIEKVGENTEFVARALARFASVRQRDIGFAGLKDRRARTRQWFSVWLPGKSDPCWDDFSSETVRVLQAIRHTKKLKRGVLIGNAFKLTIRDWRGDREQTDRLLATIKTQGIPNYFGEQRFGINGQNITKALAMFQGAKVKRQQQSLYLSAVRSFLFNEVLAERIKQKNWHTYVEGDALILDRSRSYFKTEVFDQSLQQRIDEGDVHPSGPLFGIGDSVVSSDALLIEQTVAAAYTELLAGLHKAKVERAQRALRVNVDKLHWHYPQPDQLILSFALPAGSYATSLLREIITQDN